MASPPFLHMGASHPRSRPPQGVKRYPAASIPLQPLSFQSAEFRVWPGQLAARTTVASCDWQHHLPPAYFAHFDFGSEVFMLKDYLGSRIHLAGGQHVDHCIPSLKQNQDFNFFSLHLISSTVLFCLFCLRLRAMIRRPFYRLFNAKLKHSVCSLPH